MEQVNLTPPGRLIWQLGATHGGTALLLAATAVLFAGMGVPGWVILMLASCGGAVLGLAFTTNLRREHEVAHMLLCGPADPARNRWLLQVEQAAAQQERNRLARDLHDSIKQQLFSISVSAAAAEARWAGDREHALGDLREARARAREALVEMEAMLQHLRPVPLESLGLIEALRQQCEAFRLRTGVEIALQFDPPPAEVRLPAGAQQAVFRIAQEALSNVARHARPQHVWVNLRVTEDVWMLEIRDDGQGFTVPEVVSGMGLANMRARAQELSGKLEVKSTPGGGASVRLTVPLLAARDSGRCTALDEAVHVASAAAIVVVVMGGLIGRLAPALAPWAMLVISPLELIMIGVAVPQFRMVRREVIRLALIQGRNAPEALRWERAWHEAWLLIWVLAFWVNPWYWRMLIDPLSPLRIVLIGAMVVCGAMAAVEAVRLHGIIGREWTALPHQEFRQRADSGWQRGLALLGMGSVFLGFWAFVLVQEISHLGLLASGLSYVAYLARWRGRKP